jgi:hypothetical protein
MKNKYDDVKPCSDVPISFLEYCLEDAVKKKDKEQVKLMKAVIKKTKQFNKEFEL